VAQHQGDRCFCGPGRLSGRGAGQDRHAAGR